MGEGHSKTGKSRGLPNLAKKNLIARWQNRQFSQQLFAVARHDERADGVYSFINGVRWTQTDDFRKWPYDPPLSDAGIESARETAQRLSDITQSNGCQMNVIVSSPYLRCIQTAVEICSAFGPKTRLLVDYSLGEIFGPSIMGDREPHSPVRPLEHTLAYCRRRGVSCHPKAIGKWPTWPENVRDARKRFADIFLTYLQRSSVTRRNFMLVGHADCVAACLSLMPSQAEHSIEKVDYGGLFIGKRLRKAEKPPKPARKMRYKKKMASIVPGADVDDDDDDNAVVLEPDSPTLFISNRATDNGWLDEEHRKNDDLGITEDKKVELPEAADGWEVFTLNIDLHKKAMRSSTGNRRSIYSKRISALAQNSHFSRERIDKLLGELSETPLGNDDRVKDVKDVERIMNQNQDSDPRSGTQQTVPTFMSFSTFLFGASDVGNMDDMVSELASRVPTLSEDIRIPTYADLESIPDTLGCVSPKVSMTRQRNNRLSTRVSNGSRDTPNRQCSYDEIPSPTLLTDSRRGSGNSNSPSHSLHPLSFDVVFSNFAEKVATAIAQNAQTTDEQCRHTRPPRDNEKKGSTLTNLEKVDEDPVDATKNPPLVPAVIIEKAAPSESKIIDKSSGGLPNIGNSSLLRRRQMQMALVAQKAGQ